MQEVSKSLAVESLKDLSAEAKQAKSLHLLRPLILLTLGSVVLFVLISPSLRAEGVDAEVVKKTIKVHKDYRYDALGRLSQVIDGQSGAILEHYRYDGVGNLLLKVLNGARYTYTYDAAHQLKSMEASDGLHTYDYDTAGRLIAEYLNGKAVVRYHYGYLDKVIAVERDGATTRYLYDAEGNLATKIYPDGRHENYAWDGMALILKGDTVYINEPHASGGLPIASTTNGVTTYHSYDALGTSIADYDEAGNPIKRYESTAYGEGTIQDDTTGSARFTGKLYDTEMAAYIFPFRNYDPVIVRWRSSDPIGFPDGPNNHFYAAVPTMQIDPWGLWISTVTPTFEASFDYCKLVDVDVSWFVPKNWNFSLPISTPSYSKTGVEPPPLMVIDITYTYEIIEGSFSLSKLDQDDQLIDDYIVKRTWTADWVAKSTIVISGSSEERGEIDEWRYPFEHKGTETFVFSKNLEE